MKTFTFSLLLLLFVCLPFYGNASGDELLEDNGWTIVDMYPINDNAGGLASDGEYIYIGSYGGGQGPNMYRFDPQTGENEHFFTGSHEEALGLTYANGHLWTINQVGGISDPAIALELDMEGNEVSQFALMENYMSGIAYDDGDFWVATYFPNPGTIHHVDDDGNELSSFTPPTDQPWDLAVQGDSLWIVDYWDNTIHLVEQDGSHVETFTYDDHRASGIYYDGTFLWFIGRTSTGESTLYKVEPWGTGTPVIDVVDSHHFGNVTIGDAVSWDMAVFNQGTGDLIIDELLFPPDNDAFTVIADFPLTVEPDSFEEITITFEPLEIARYDEILEIHTNDPAVPVTEVEIFGNGLASGPHLEATQEELDFGSVRMNSSNRLYMEVRNMGDEDLVFDDITFSSEDFWWDWTVEFPITLEPVQYMELPIWFQPLTPGEIEEEATLLFNNEDQSPHTIDLTGMSDDEDLMLGEVIWDVNLPGSTMNNPRAITSIPDVTGNGFDDVLVCTRGTNIMLYNGNASGTSELLWDIELGTVEYPKGVAVTDDLNDDGFFDIIVGTAYGDRAVTALSARTGEIIWRFETTIFGGGGWVYMVDVTYDYNGNGYRDVLAATGDDGQGTGPKRIFLLNGENGEIIWETSMGGAAFSVLAVEDFTGDGVPDVIGGGQTPDQNGKVIGISGADGSIQWELNTAGSSVWALEQISDINESGVRDIMVGSFSGHYYLVDATDGEVVYSGNLGNAIILDLWQAGDLNEDGYIDVYPAYSSIPQAVAISGKDGQYIWSTPVADQPWSVAPLRDITGDGINDVAIGTLFDDNFIYFLSGSDGQKLDSIPMPDAVDAIGVLPDVTGDNSMEVVGSSRNNYVAAFSGGTKVQDEHHMISFIVTEEQDPANPIEEATIVLSPEGHTLTTDEDGFASMELLEGSYEYTVSRDGYFSEEGTVDLFEDKTIEVELVTDDTDIDDIPAPQVANAYNYPNPFADFTNIVFTLTQETEATIFVYTMDGRKMTIVPAQNFPAGENSVRWDGNDPQGAALQSGIYIFEVHTEENVYRDRMFILKD